MFLELNNLNTFYGQAQVLWDLSLKVRQGAVVALLGRNGMGKTTTMHSIMGLVPPRRGVIRYQDQPIESLEPFHISRLGIALVPQGRGIFPSLTVKENLTLGARNRDKEDPWTIDRVYSQFPILNERSNMYANLLSGGEQQMLAIGRALMANPKILLLDEPSLGLAPILVKTIFDILRKINETGVTVVLVEQNARAALKLAHRGYVMEVGYIVLEGSAEGLLSNPDVLHAYLGGRRRVHQDASDS